MENSTSYDFTSLTPGELEQRRRALIDRISTYPGGVDACPLDWLHENAELTKQLRRRTSGPPKAKPKAKTQLPTTTDLLSDI